MTDPDLIHSLYDAALEPDGFGQLGGLLARAMDSSHGVVILRRGMLPLELSVTTPEKAMQAYLTHFGQLDPWAKHSLAMPSWAILESQRHVSEDDLLRSEFYVDYARDLDMHHPMGVHCPFEGGLTLSIGVDRPRRASFYGESEKQLLIDLLRHLRRALEIRRQAEARDGAVATGYAALDALAFGVVVVDAAGRQLFVNRAAEALHRAGCGLLLGRGRVQACMAPDAKRLAALVHDVAQNGPGGAMQLRDRDGEPSLIALVSPLPRRMRTERHEEPLALIALRRLSDVPANIERVLSGLFGLSRAEAEVARGLAHGSSLDDLSRDRNVKVSTLKTQLDSIFRKTGTESQRDLARLIGSLPQLR